MFGSLIGSDGFSFRSSYTVHPNPFPAIVKDNFSSAFLSIDYRPCEPPTRQLTLWEIVIAGHGLSMNGPGFLPPTLHSLTRLHSFARTIFMTALNCLKSLAFM